MRAAPLLATLLLAACLATVCRAADDTTWVQKIAQAEAFYKDKQYARAIEAYRAALASGASHPETYYDLATQYALLGDKDTALTLLEEAARRGVRGAEQMLADSDTAGLRADPRWSPFLARVRANEADYMQRHGDPDAARFVTSDVALFWAVYDKLPAAKDAAEAAALLDRDYLAKGSVGLYGFIGNRIKSGANLYARLQSRPRYYAGIRANTLNLKPAEAEIRAGMRAFKQLYPEAVFPDIFFVIGNMSSGGTISADGLLMGTELFSRDASVPIDELSPWERNGSKSIALLPNITLHELMHFQQRYSAPDSLLVRALREGSADFLAQLVTRGNFNEVAYAYAYANEAALKRQFAADLQTNNFKPWLGSASLDGERPADLGYFMGFRIAQVYYEKAADKRQAVRDLLNVADAQALLSQSGYLQADPALADRR